MTQTYIMRIAQSFLICILILCGGVFFTHTARALQAGDQDPSFFSGVPGGANNHVYATALLSDGKILIGGSFTTYNGVVVNRIARVNPDSSLDTTFRTGTGMGGSVRKILLQPDGKMLIGGSFTAYNGVTANRIVRLNADGTRDTTFTGTGADNSVLGMALQPDGKIIISGLFTTYNGTAINRITRLNADGTLDTTFTVGTGADGEVFTVALQPDTGGKIFVMAVPVAGIAPSRKALSTKALVSSAFSPSSAMI